jgi:hypothetical protein
VPCAGVHAKRNGRRLSTLPITAGSRRPRTPWTWTPERLSPPNIHKADQGDTATIVEALESARKNLSDIGCTLITTAPTEVIADQGYHSREVVKELDGCGVVCCVRMLSTIAWEAPSFFLSRAAESRLESGRRPTHLSCFVAHESPHGDFLYTQFGV